MKSKRLSILGSTFIFSVIAVGSLASTPLVAAQSETHFAQVPIPFASFAY